MIEDGDKRGYYNLDRVTETIDESDGVIRSAIVQTKGGLYKRPVVKLAPVLPGKEVFAMENRAGDVAAELANATEIYIIADNTVHKSLLQKHNIRTDLKPLKRTGRCKVFLDFDRRAAVTCTFGILTLIFSF